MVPNPINNARQFENLLIILIKFYKKAGRCYFDPEKKVAKEILEEKIFWRTEYTGWGGNVFCPV